jgi:hypothetical protein
LPQSMNVAFGGPEIAAQFDERGSHRNLIFHLNISARSASNFGQYSAEKEG